MRIEERRITELFEYENNPRKNDHAVEAVAKAIEQYGFRVPILARANGEIIDGHLRYKAARFLGLETVPVLPADDMGDEEVRAFRISVNKLASLAKWDTKLLEQEIKSLRELELDLSCLGFTEVELDDLAGAGGRQKDPDALPEQVLPVSQPGDLWLLGDHRLAVGDSRELSTYVELLQGDPEGRADMLWTDPPYNVDYSGKAGKIKNDKMSDEDFSLFLSRFYSAAISALQPGAPAYVAHADGRPSVPFRSEFVAAGFYYSTVLIWRKSQSTIGRADYHFQHEPLLYGWAPGAAHRWYGGRKRKSIIEFGDPPLFVASADGGGYQIEVGNEVLLIRGDNVTVESVAPSIIEFDKPHSSKLHPAMKPVALVEYCLLNSSRPGDVVLDGFGGSGTTMIACELRGRKARLVELEPKFADVIVQRWQEFTGREAVLSTGQKFSDLLEARGCNAREN